MKGFLNKVQNKVVGGKPSAEGKPAQPVGEAMPSAGANAAKIDGTPRADISLPKKSDRRYDANSYLPKVKIAI